MRFVSLEALEAFPDPSEIADDEDMVGADEALEAPGAFVGPPALGEDVVDDFARMVAAIALLTPRGVNSAEARAIAGEEAAAAVADAPSSSIALSDVDPLAIGGAGLVEADVADPGVGTEASRADHHHEHGAVGYGLDLAQSTLLVDAAEHTDAMGNEEWPGRAPTELGSAASVAALAHPVASVHDDGKAAIALPGLAHVRSLLGRPPLYWPHAVGSHVRNVAGIGAVLARVWGNDEAADWSASIGAAASGVAITTGTVTDTSGNLTLVRGPDGGRHVVRPCLSVSGVANHGVAMKGRYIASDSTGGNRALVNGKLIGPDQARVVVGSFGQAHPVWTSGTITGSAVLDLRVGAFLQGDTLSWRMAGDPPNETVKDKFFGFRLLGAWNADGTVTLTSVEACHVHTTLGTYVGAGPVPAIDLNDYTYKTTQLTQRNFNVPGGFGVAMRVAVEIDGRAGTARVVLLSNDGLSDVAESFALDTVKYGLVSPGAMLIKPSEPTGGTLTPTLFLDGASTYLPDPRT